MAKIIDVLEFEGIGPVRWREAQHGDVIVVNSTFQIRHDNGGITPVKIEPIKDEQTAGYWGFEILYEGLLSTVNQTTTPASLGREASSSITASNVVKGQSDDPDAEAYVTVPAARIGLSFLDQDENPGKYVYRINSTTQGRPDYDANRLPTLAIWVHFKDPSGGVKERANRVIFYRTGAPILV